MTFRAILDDGQEHKPVLLLMTGQLSPRQIDAEYRGAVGQCPDCERRLRNADVADGSGYAAALSGVDRRVRYRKGIYAPDQDVLVRQMHFKHCKNYRQHGIPSCEQQSRNRLLHIEAVEAIAHQYRKDMPEGFRVEAECQFVKAGTPPEAYRPDIAVFNAFGGRHTCIEYQRSPEPFERFVHRHRLRGSEWGSVVWFFDKAIWNRKSTCEARDWLFDGHQTFYKCWVDEQTLQLQVEEGTFATTVVKTSQHPWFPLHRCSDADIMQQDENRRLDGDLVYRRQQQRPKADRLQGFNLVEKSETDRKKSRELFELLKRQQAEQQQRERQMREQAALREQQERERVDKQKRLSFISRLANDVRALGQSVETSADMNWTPDQLQAEAMRLTYLAEEIRERQEAARRKEAAMRQVQMQWDAEAKEALEQCWRPIVYREETIRGQRIMATVLGENATVRRYRGAIPERYLGMKGSYYLTDRMGASLHATLEGWEVLRLPDGCLDACSTSGVDPGCLLALAEKVWPDFIEQAADGLGWPTEDVPPDLSELAQLLSHLGGRSIDHVASVAIGMISTYGHPMPSEGAWGYFYSLRGEIEDQHLEQPVLVGSA